MPDLDDHHAAWIGQTLTDASGHKIGKIDDIYTDDDTGQPEWLAVSAGLRGPDTYFVPMRGATVSGRGVQVPFPKDQVKLASTSTADGTLSRLVKGRLYAHYGCSYAEERNLLQRSLGFDPPDLNRPAHGRDVVRAVALLELSRPADVREVSGPADVAALSDPAKPDDMSPSTDVRDQSSPADVREVSRPADVRDLLRPGSLVDVCRPVERLDEGGRLPPAGRGRWPDDEAIFGLAQPIPSLTSSGAARGR